MSKTKIRIRKRQGDFDTHYVIDEIVDTNGHYIVWPGHYATKESAEKELEKKLITDYEYYESY